MDPNEAIQKFRERHEYAVLTAAYADEMRETSENVANVLMRQANDAYAECANIMGALDNWISKGGFLPKEWDRQKVI